MNSTRSRRLLFLIAAGAVITLALGLRFYGRRWDGGWYMQPDERFMVMVLTERIHAPDIHHLVRLFDPAHSPLNPRGVDQTGHTLSYAYGSLPLYATDLAAAFAGLLTRQDLNAYSQVGLVGRSLTALVDAATILLAMLLARRLYGRGAALITGFLLATTVTMIQLAHFFTVDAWVTMFSTAVLLASFRLWQRPSSRRALVAGLLVGAALATKVSVFTLFAPIAVALILAFWPRGITEAVRLTIGRLFVAGAGALVTFAIFEPYALWQPAPFLSDVDGQWRMAKGIADLPYTRQFVGRIPVRYELGNLVHWGLGPFFGIAALAALVAAALRWRKLRPGELILLSWIVPYFAVIATAQAKYLRYCEPIVPALAILTGGLLAAVLLRWPARTWRGAGAVGLVAVVLTATAGWALAFESIYAQPNARVAASDWIFRNIPPGSTLTAEWWDDSLPMPLPNMPLPNQAYKQITLDLYGDRPNQQEFDYIAGFVADSDYIILASNRLADSIPRLPWRYPVASQYYSLLESGQLGFQLVYQSNAAPRLGPIQIDDQSADESFTVYDHPQIRIYKKVTTLSQDQLRQRFASSIAAPWTPARTPPSPSLMLSTPVDQQPAVNDLGWSAPFSTHAWVAIPGWLLLMTLFGLLAVPLTTVLFGRFADVGWGFSRSLGLLLVGYAVWIAVSLQLIQFRLPDLLLVAALVVAVEWLVFRRRVVESLALLRAKWRLVFASEAVFLATFAFFLTLRAINPDLWQTFWGGEKPMELSFIQAIARSAHFPPYDPWYSGGQMNYYYYGFYLMALLWKLSGIVPEVAFQLSIATVAALLASSVFSLTATLGGDLMRTRRVRWLVTAGVSGVVLDLFIGNLDGIRQLVQHPASTFDFWQSSRVVDYGITEFPYFTMSWADLHPHAINLPFTVLLLALGYRAIRSGLDRWWMGASALVLGSVVVINSWDMPYGALLLGAAALTALIRARGWGWRPLALGLGAWAVSGAGAYLLFRPFFSNFVALVNGVARTGSGTAAGQYGIHFGIFLGILAVAAVALVVARWEDLYPGVMPLPTAVAALPALAGFGAAALAARHLSLEHFVLGAIVSALCGALLSLLLNSPSLPGRRALWLVVSAGLAIALGLLLPARPTAALVLVPLAGGLRLWLGNLDNAAVSAGGVFLIGASGISFGADLIYIVDDLSGSPWERMNTIFKFYVESWTLFALAATVALVWLFQQARLGANQRLGIVAGTRRAAGPLQAAERATLAARMGLTVALCLVALGFIYPILGTPSRLEQRMNSSPTSLTLDGLSWMKGGELLSGNGKVIDFTGDYDAIMWLRAHDLDNGVVLEASIGPYRGNGSRIAAGTGLPDVLGWDRHERQQRYQPGIDQRLQDVRTIYDTTDQARKLQLLREYRVRYVVVGDVERDWSMPDGSVYASAQGLAALGQMVGHGLRIAFTSGHTTIYEVDPFPALAPAASAKGPA